MFVLLLTASFISERLSVSLRMCEAQIGAVPITEVSSFKGLLFRVSTELSLFSMSCVVVATLDWSVQELSLFYLLLGAFPQEFSLRSRHAGEFVHSQTGDSFYATESQTKSWGCASYFHLSSSFARLSQESVSKLVASYLKCRR